MARRAKMLGRRRLLDDPAAIEDRDPVGDARNQRKIVRDVERGDAGLACAVREQVEDTRAGDDVERRGRLVEDDAFGLAGEGGGDDDALLSPPETSCG